MAKESKAPANESNADKFKRLAIARTNNALKAIALVGGLSNKANYEYNDEQVSSIMKALEAEVIKVANRFKNPAAPAEGGFSL